MTRRLPLVALAAAVIMALGMLLIIVTGHIDRRNEVEPTWANVFQVQVGDAVNVRPFYQVAEHLLPNFGANDLSNQKAAIAIDQEDRDDR